MVTIFGWFSADAARASRRKRSRPIAVESDAFFQSLDGDVKLEVPITGAVDGAHTSLSQAIHDVERAESRARSEVHVGSLAAQTLAHRGGTSGSRPGPWAAPSEV